MFEQDTYCSIVLFSFLPSSLILILVLVLVFIFCFTKYFTIITTTTTIYIVKNNFSLSFSRLVELHPLALSIRLLYTLHYLNLPPPNPLSELGLPVSTFLFALLFLFLSLSLSPQRPMFCNRRRPFFLIATRDSRLG